MKFLPFCLLIFLTACDKKTETITVEVLVQPPEPSSALVTVDVNAGVISGDYTLNGGAFPNSVYQAGIMMLKDSTTMHSVELGASYHHSYEIFLVNDTYQPVYLYSNGDMVPVNPTAEFSTPIVVAGDQNADLDLDRVQVRPQFTLNGVAFPSSVYVTANFYLQPVNGEPEILIAQSHLQNDSVNIVPGVYHLIYRHTNGEAVPANQNYRIASDLNINSDQVLNYNLLAYDVRTSFLLNGQAFPQHQYDYAKFYLVNRTTNDFALIGHSYDQPTTVLIMSGVYDAEYRYQIGASVPINKKKTVEASLNLNFGGAVNIDVNANSLTIQATLNGSPFEVSEYEDGVLELYDSESNSYSMLGNTHSALSNIVVVPGEYDIHYSHETGDEVPLNTRGKVMSDVDIQSDMQLPLDVVAYWVDASVTLNTVTFPDDQDDYANLLLVGNQSTQPVVIAPSFDLSQPVLVLGGTYDLYYQCVQCENIPWNNNFLISAAHVIDSDETVSGSMKSVRIDLSSRLNNQSFPQSIYQVGMIWGGTNADDVFFMSETFQTTEDIIVAEGSYDFYYQHHNGENVPQNSWALVDSDVINAPPSK